MKKPEEYKCHEIMKKYTSYHTHQNFATFGNEVFLKKEELNKIFQDFGFNEVGMRGSGGGIRYAKDNLETEKSWWNFKNDMTFRNIDNMQLINSVTKAKVRYGKFKYFGDFLIYEIVENYCHWAKPCSWSWDESWVLNEGVTTKQIIDEMTPKVYEWLKEHIEQSLVKISLDNKKRIISQKKQAIESDADLKIMDLMDELKKFEFNTEVKTNTTSSISKTFVIKKLFHNYTGMINPTITIRKNISGSYDISTNINQNAEFDKIRKLPSNGDRIVEIVNMLLDGFKTLPTSLKHSSIENFKDVK